MWIILLLLNFRPPQSLPNPLVMIEQASAGYGSGESAVEILGKN